MPLQNRVDPFGTIHAVRERGLFTGNRGIIHDPATRTLLKRRWTTTAWIICVCEFRGRKRPVMGPGANGNGSWTELFFLDEVTALAAGHRPCFHCRRPAAADFAERFGNVTGMAAPKAARIDAALHAERLAAGASPHALDPADLAGLPDGVMIAVGGQPHALRGGRLLPWSFAGYGTPLGFATAAGRGISVLTPGPTCAVLADGFLPVWHPSAGP